jgi:signal-transduction protein with cAMP-binding, CBS, and nucleotidyltransferase domain
MSNLTNFLKQADIFYQFTATQLEMVANLCQDHSYAKSETAVEDGASSKELYIITQGEVYILVNPSLVSKLDTSQEIVTTATLRRSA